MRDYHNQITDYLSKAEKLNKELLEGIQQLEKARQSLPEGHPKTRELLGKYYDLQESVESHLARPPKLNLF